MYIHYIYINLECLYFSEALLSLPSLTVFKQEVPSPSQENLTIINHQNLQPNTSEEAEDHNSSTLHRLLQQSNCNNHVNRRNCINLNKGSDLMDKKNEDYRLVLDDIIQKE